MGSRVERSGVEGAELAERGSGEQAVQSRGTMEQAEQSGGRREQAEQSGGYREQAEQSEEVGSWLNRAGKVRTG